jgi:hypothetical protein
MYLTRSLAVQNYNVQQKSRPPAKSDTLGKWAWILVLGAFCIAEQRDIKYILFIQDYFAEQIWVKQLFERISHFLCYTKISKGTVSQDFLLKVFLWSVFPQAPDNYKGVDVDSNFFEIRGDFCRSRSTTGVVDTGVHLDLRISPRIFEKYKNDSNGGRWFKNKNLKQKIS